MSTIFCCSSIQPHRPQKLDHEPRFNEFLKWAHGQTTSLAPENSCSLASSTSYVVQLVRQVNYGPQESIRFFSPKSNSFMEATENDLLEHNFEKLNSYKNYTCKTHNKFFELNLYQKNPHNTHHWRATLARPSRDIDLAFRQKKCDMEGPPTSQKKDAELVSSDTQGEVLSNSPKSLPKAVHDEFEVKSLKEQPDCQLDSATLKNILRLLLPIIGKHFPSSSLMLLLSLDWANTNLNLGLELEDIWRAELTRSNFIIFLSDILANESSPYAKIDSAEIEDLLIPALAYVDSRQKKEVPGKTKLHEVVNRVLDSGRTLQWVTLNRGKIESMFTSGPSAEALERCRRNNEFLQQTLSDEPKILPSGQSRKVSTIPDLASMEQFNLHQQDDEEFVSGLGHAHFDEIESYYTFDSSFEDDSDFKDLTACDKECGYCANCGY